MGWFADGDGGSGERWRGEAGGLGGTHRSLPPEQHDHEENPQTVSPANTVSNAWPSDKATAHTHRRAQHKHPHTHTWLHMQAHSHRNVEIKIKSIVKW